jgi:RNA polymerase sigma-70 factor, ECF subfamily
VSFADAREPTGDPGGAEVVPVDPVLRLVRRCQAGEPAAWTELYRQEGPRVARFLRRLLGPSRDTDDIVQQVFVEVFAALPSFRGDARLSTWIYGIAANVARKKLRSERYRKRYLAALVDELASDAADERGGGAPDDCVAAREELDRLAAAVDALPVKLRLVWVLRVLEELPTEDVAAALDIPIGTVRSRLHLARRQVDAALAEEVR